jgi:LysR family transcriptional regulator, salicylic acid-responsive activator of bsdBCD
MDMSDIDYNKLRFFLTVVRCESITGASRELHRTQSAVSQAISALEQQIGVKLIIWEGKRMQLTREGKLVYQAAALRMEAIDEQLKAVSLSGEEVAGSIEIGMLHDHSSRMQVEIFQIIAQFRKKYPAVTFKIHFGTSAMIEQALLDREIDIGILINYKEQHRFTLFQIATEEHIVVSSPQYKITTIDHVLDSNLIDIDPYFTCFTPWITQHAPKKRELLEKKVPAIVVADFLAIRELVLQGAGIAVIPKFLIEKELESGALVQVAPKLSTLRVWVTAATLRGTDNRLSVDYFLKALSLIS